MRHAMNWPITPVPAPRQVRKDAWNPSDAVCRYRAFRDEVRLRRVTLEAGDHVEFVLAMPRSWSKRKRAEMDGQPHTQRPDLDNLWKALGDAIHGEDAHIHTMSANKVWGEAGCIRVFRRQAPLKSVVRP